jgi:membrane carboxypeptidase/penicillin-binding protein
MTSLSTYLITPILFYSQQVIRVLLILFFHLTKELQDQDRLPGPNYTNTIVATNNGTMEQWNKKRRYFYRLFPPENNLIK